MSNMFTLLSCTNITYKQYIAIGKHHIHGSTSNLPVSVTVSAQLLTLLYLAVICYSLLDTIV